MIESESFPPLMVTEPIRAEPVALPPPALRMSSPPAPESVRALTPIVVRSTSSASFRLIPEPPIVIRSAAGDPVMVRVSPAPAPRSIANSISSVVPASFTTPGSKAPPDRSMVTASLPPAPVMFTESRFDTVDPPQLVAVRPVPDTLMMPASLRATVTVSFAASVMFTAVPTEAQAAVA